jgi:adenosylmethionine-8-amino-7-oxononanoate aminotransferase
MANRPSSTENASRRSCKATVERIGGTTSLHSSPRPVGGATSGALTPPPGYFKRVREICDRHGMLLILDEVMCGMGRTGTLHACEQEGIAPDLMAIAKGLGGGYQPVGAVLIGSKVIDAIGAGSGFFQHGHTYIGHPVAVRRLHLRYSRFSLATNWSNACAQQGARLGSQVERSVSRASVCRRCAGARVVSGDRTSR